MTAAFENPTPQQYSEDGTLKQHILCKPSISINIIAPS